MNLGFEKPEVTHDGEELKSSSPIKVTIKPLERGLGVTYGNMFRRTLLQAIPGTSTIGIKIEDVYHEHQSIPHAAEDMMDVILNLKKIRFEILDDTEEVIKIEFKGNKNKVYYAKDIKMPSNVELHTPNVKLITLTGTGEVTIELYLKKGRGYVKAKNITEFDNRPDIIATDGLFSPVVRVVDIVKEMRIGNKADYDELELEVETDGSMHAKEAVLLASKILRSGLDFVDNMKHIDTKYQIYKEKQEEENKLLDKEIEQLEFSVRSRKRLKKNDIHTVRDLIELEESDVTGIPQLGKKSIKEIMDKIKEIREQMNNTDF